MPNQPILPTCPACNKEIRELEYEPLDASERGTFNRGATIKAVLYICPNCKRALGAGTDPR